jgi:hypothetical protein
VYCDFNVIYIIYIVLITLQYAYTILSIISGFVVLAVTFFITILTSFFSLSRLHFDKIPVSTFWISLILNPALWSYRAALMVDHDNTNPIKFMALEWFRDRLQAIRKAEVDRLGSCISTCERRRFWAFYCSFNMNLDFCPIHSLPERSHFLHLVAFPQLHLMNVLQELAFLAAQESFGDNYRRDRKIKPIRAERIRNRFVVFSCHNRWCTFHA